MITQRLAAALDFAVRAHGDQERKGTKIPYVSHLLGVAALVFEGGGDEELAIAGLLHDVLEDTSASSGQLEEAFGTRVTHIVEACSDTQEKPKPPARARKERYLEHLQTADPDTLLVSLADKLHNARTLLLEFPYWWPGCLRTVPSQPGGHLVVLQRTREDVLCSTTGRTGRRVGPSRRRPQPGGADSPIGRA